MPAKLLVSKRGSTERVFGRLGSTRHRTRRDKRGVGADAAKPKRRAKQTFVDSLPAAACALDAATRALRKECYETLGPRAPIVLDGTAWRGEHVEEGRTNVHAEFLSRRMPWAFYRADGAEDMLDERQDDNPHVQLGVTGRDSRHIHALVTTFVDATALWPEAGRRISMGKRQADDDTPNDSRAPQHFATQHAVMLNVKPLQWVVPEAYDGAVSRVIARLEDADVPTRFWVVCPVKSELLRREHPAWFAFCDTVCAAAMSAKPVPHATAVLIPVVPGITETSAVQCLENLEHACVHAGGIALPPARILEARLSGYLRLDESGAESARFEKEEEDEDEEGDDTGEKTHEATETDTDTDKDDSSENSKDSEDEDDAEKSKDRALAFSAHDDLLVVVCDTRVACPLVSFVVQNGDMRRFVFRDAEKYEDGEKDDESDDEVYDWGQFQSSYEWLAWTADM